MIRAGIAAAGSLLRKVAFPVGAGLARDEFLNVKTNRGQGPAPQPLFMVWCPAGHEGPRKRFGRTGWGCDDFNDYQTPGPEPVHIEIVECGPINQILTRPENPYTQVLMASVPHPRVGWLDEAIEERNAVLRSADNLMLSS